MNRLASNSEKESSNENIKPTTNIRAQCFWKYVRPKPQSVWSKRMPNGNLNKIILIHNNSMLSLCVHWRRHQWFIIHTYNKCFFFFPSFRCVILVCLFRLQMLAKKVIKISKEHESRFLICKLSQCTKFTWKQSDTKHYNRLRMSFEHT